jgi:hypothetical protein
MTATVKLLTSGASEPIPSREIEYSALGAARKRVRIKLAAAGAAGNDPLHGLAIGEEGGDLLDGAVYAAALLGRVDDLPQADGDEVIAVAAQDLDGLILCRVREPER